MDEQIYRRWTSLNTFFDTFNETTHAIKMFFSWHLPAVSPYKKMALEYDKNNIATQ